MQGKGLQEFGSLRGSEVELPVMTQDQVLETHGQLRRELFEKSQLFLQHDNPQHDVP